MSKKKNSYWTCITNEKYIPGLVGLVKALKKVKANYPLTVCIPDNDNLYALLKKNRVFAHTIIIKKSNIDIPDTIDTYDHWKESFFKLTSASMTDFEKIVVLDVDMLICKNIDELFDSPLGSSVSDIENISLPYKESNRFNSGVFVLKPNQELYLKLIENISVVAKERKKSGLKTGDQDVFNHVISDWGGKTELHLNRTYNMFWPCLQIYIKDKMIKLDDVKIIHFIGPQKPWQYSLKQVFKETIDLVLDGKNFKLAFVFLKYYLSVII